jgi:hypothetical protein
MTAPFRASPRQGEHPQPPELDFADMAQFKHFQQEIARAARGEISPEWLARSYDALPPSVKSLFGELPK